MSDLETKISKMRQDIKDIKIQGATNVALTTLEGIIETARKSKATTVSKLIEEVERTGILLSSARENEPLAKNGLRYVLSKIRSFPNIITTRKVVEKAAQEYLGLIRDSKDRLFEYGVKELSDSKVILTHCHSSTSTNILIALYKKNPKLNIVSTETRPLFQGRLTAEELTKAKVRVTQIVDSAAPSFIEDDRYLPVDSVLVGADEILADGGFINKVGTYSMALAAKAGKDRFYVATTLLKVNLEKSIKYPEIEMRSAKEIWPQAPANLQIINPAFDFIHPRLVTAFITEAGVVAPNEIKQVALETYPWLAD